MLKKFTLIKLTMLLCLLVSTNLSFSQTIFSEDFEGTLDAGTGLPSGWSETGLSSDGIYSVGTDVEANAAGFWPVPAHTMFAQSNDDVCNCDKSADRLILPAQDLSSFSGAARLFFSAVADDEYGGTYTVEVSTDGGTNWTVINTLTPTSATYEWQEGIELSLTPYLGMSNVLVSFLYSDLNGNGDWATGFAIDDVSIVIQAATTDLAITSDALNEYTIKPLSEGSVNLAINATVTNVGDLAVANYTVLSKVYLDPDYTNALQTFTFNGTNLAVGGTNTVNQGSYLATGLGSYVVVNEVISAGDVNTTNDSAIGVFTFDNVEFARDLGNLNGGPLGLGIGTELVIGNTFTISNTLRLDSVLFAFAPNVVGGNVSVQINGMNGSNVPDETNVLGMSVNFPVDQALIDFVTANNLAVLTLPVTDMSSNPLVLAPGTYFIGAKQDVDVDNYRLLHADGIVTANTAFYSANGGAFTDLQTVSLVTPIVRGYVTEISNIPPVAADDNATTTQDVAVAINVVANDTDADNTIQNSSIVIASNPTNGSVSINTTTGVITYTPNAGYFGNDQFTYTICDNGSPVECDNAVVSITVNSSTPSLVLDFSNPTDWVMGNDAGNSDNWVVGTGVPSGSFAIPGITSTTAANGFAMFDSDLLCSGSQSAWIGNATPLDLSMYTSPKFQFESFYQKWTDETFLQVSTDNVNWTSFQVHSTFAQDDNSATNPEVISVNISSAVTANPSNVYFRFYFLSDASNGGDGCDYAWMVDDISISENPSYDLAISEVIFGSSSDWGLVPSRFVPTSQVAPVTFAGVVNNAGGQSDDATFNASTTGYNGSSLATTLTPNQIDTLFATTDFTSNSTAGTVNTITFNVAAANSDFDLSNNTIADETITITTNEYGNDNGVGTGGVYAEGNAYEVGNIFNIHNNTTLANALVNVHALANPGATIYAKLYQVNPLAGTAVYLDYFTEIYTSATTHTIAAGDLDAWVTIPFDVPQNLVAGNSYALVIGSLGDGGATYDFVCNTSVAGSFGTSIYYDEATLAMYNQTDIPMVRMQLEDPLVTITSNDVDNMACTGQTITLTSSLATGNVWSNGATTQSIDVTTNGTYEVVNNGVTSNAITVTFDGPQLATTSTDISCNALCDGTASVSFTDNGFGGNNVVWSNASTATNLTDLCAGNYTVSATDMIGCSTTGSVTINEPAAISFTISSTDLSCNGVCDGTATVTFTGGTGTITHTWSGASTAATITQLCAGNYDVTATDANGCSVNATASVGEPTLLTASTTSTTSTCGNADGSATVVANGGTGTLSYMWSNGQTNATAINLASGNYSVSVTDANGCSVNSSASVSDAGAPTLTVSSTNASCNGVCDGAAMAMATGGNGTISYLWSNGSSLDTQSGLCAGVYNVTATDANACTASASVTISEPAMLNATMSATDATCGNTNGSATVVATGGSGSYTYLWSNGDVNSSLSNLGSGTYSVTVTDGSGCSVMNTVSVNDLGAPIVSITSTDATCNSACNGTANASVTGGNGTITYLWTNGLTSASIDALCAGTYSVTATDANACATTSDVTISEPNAIVVTTSSTTSTCGNTDGSVSVVANGGTGTLTYMWSNGSDQTTVNNLSAGTYTVTVMDVSQCSVSATATISDAGAPTLTTTSTNASCNAVCDGTAMAMATGGNGTISFMWSNGSTSDTQAGLCAGVYSVTATDANGCSANASVTITEPSAIVANTSSTNSTCGNNDGSVTVIANGGTGNYTYSWSNGANTSTVTNLGSGNYVVTVTDGSGCSVMNSVSINDLGAPSLSAIATDATCNSVCDGTASVTVTGGTGTISYLWSNGLASASIDALCAGTYSVTATDANGCSSSISVNVNEPNAIVATTSSTTSTCGNADGTVSVMATGGTGTLTYMWSNGSDQATVNNLNAGTYTVTVMDASQCSITATATVSDAGAPSLTAMSTNASCNAVCDGTAMAMATGGNGTISYLWSNGSTVDTQIGLCAGVYTVTATDANGCSANASVTITEPSAIVANTSSTSSTCGNNDGSVTVIANGGTGNYTYSWSNGANTSSVSNVGSGNYVVTVTDDSGCSVMNNASVSDIGAPSAATISSTDTDNMICEGESITLSSSSGTLNVWSTGETTNSITVNTSGVYSLSRIDANGCQSASVSVTVTVNALPNVNAGANVAVCSGESVTLTGTGASNLSWDDATVSNGVSFIPTATTTYTLTGTDAIGCQNTDVVTVTVNNVPVTPTISLSSDAILCGNETVVLTSSAANGIEWSTGATTQSITVNAAGDYSVTRTNGAGCASTSAIVTITSGAAVVVNAGANVSICQGESVTLTGTGATTYSWNGGVENGVPFTPNATTTYTVTGSNAEGCQDTDNVIVTVGNLPVTPTITTNVDPSLCGNETITLTSSTATGIVWSNGATTASITVGTAGNYSVTKTNGAGCSSTSAIVSVTVNPNPTVNAGLDLSICNDASVTLAATGASTYTWDNGVIDGQAFVPTVSGTYTVTGTDVNGCIGTDALEILLNNCIGLTENSISSINVYPNPSAGLFTVSLENVNEFTSYKVIDQVGKVVEMNSINSTNFGLDLTNVSKGIYYLELTGNSNQMIKLEVLK